MPDLRIGISGWTYAPWRGVFYPPKWPHKRELEHASRQFNAIEINGTFYSTQRPTSFARWYGETPDGFVFSVKGGQFITHIRRLKDCQTPLANFFAQGILTLKEKLGPILWQLPPTLKFEPDRIESFLALLPHDTEAAAKLAGKHDARMKGKTDFAVDKKRKVRHAMEVRHETFRDPAFIKLLRKHNVALVVADTAGRWPLIADVTADFVYARLHGDVELYASGYTSAALEKWAKKVRAWARGGDAPDARRAGSPAKRRASGRDVFVFFDNDVKVRSPFDSGRLAEMLGVNDAPPKPFKSLAGIEGGPRLRPPTRGRSVRSAAKDTGDGRRAQ